MTSMRAHFRNSGLLRVAFAAAAIGTLASPATATELDRPLPPLRALVITGHNNHNWPFTSRVHEETLEATGKFTVDVTDTPATTLADAAKLASYQVFILDYNDSHAVKRWGDAAEKNFLQAVRNGVGVVAIHSANNAFKGWSEYETMLGLMWRDGTGHGAFHPFDVQFTDRDHPITEGMSDLKAHPDELYHKLVNSQNAPYKLLAQAMSTPESGGTGKNEPMAMTLEFGKGRVFATPLGHVWSNDEKTKVSVLNPAFRALVARGAEWAATGSVSLPAEWSDARTHNILTPDEQSAGWTLLFDGKTSQFRGFKKSGWPEKGWTIADGVLRHPAGGGGGDLVTLEQYGDFEFACEWKAAPGANSGVIYRSTEDQQWSWMTGYEMQILDDSGHKDKANPKTRAGTLYDIQPCAADVSRPAGSWNSARVVARGTRIEHWLNGVKVVDLDVAGDEYKKAHAASKWPQFSEYGKRAKGHIVLQDHGDLVEFRNIKVRKLD